MNLLLLGKMEFSKCIENVGTAQTEKWFSLKSCPCSLKGTQLPDAQEGQKGAEGQRVRTGVQGEELLGRFSSRVSRSSEAHPAEHQRVPTCLAELFVTWKSHQMVYCLPRSLSEVRSDNKCAAAVVSEWVKDRAVSELDTPPGNATRTRNSNNQVIERSFPAASVCTLHFSQLHLHRLFPWGLQGKCHENVVIDLPEDEPRGALGEGLREILKTSSFIFPGKGGEGFPDLRKGVLPACQVENPFQDCLISASGVTVKCHRDARRNLKTAVVKILTNPAQAIK